jgi:vacuolar protein sorting-associated protein 13A/C
LNIPWKSLASSKIEVLLEGLEVVIGAIPESKWDTKNHKIIEKRKKEIQDYCESVINDFAKRAAKEKKTEDDEGYFSKLTVKIIDNLQVTVKDIHIRYEDDIDQE